jgi:hypothetical protein
MGLLDWKGVGGVDRLDDENRAVVLAPSGGKLAIDDACVVVSPEC